MTQAGHEPWVLGPTLLCSSPLSVHPGRISKLRTSPRALLSFPRPLGAADATSRSGEVFSPQSRCSTFQVPALQSAALGITHHVAVKKAGLRSSLCSCSPKSPAGKGRLPRVGCRHSWVPGRKLTAQNLTLNLEWLLTY